LIDLHNHILPSLDDGAHDLAESVEIVVRFVEEGVAAVAATPHLDPLHNRGASPGQIAAALEAVRTELASRGIDLRVHPGQEVFLTPGIVELMRSGSALPLGHSRYVLVELSLVALERPLYLEDALFRLQRAEYRPILAHPERYPFVQRDPDAARELASRGIALQLTAPALLGEYGSRVRRTAERLLRSGAYALAASDRHHPGHGRSLSTLRSRLEDAFEPELGELLLVTNPGRVLDDQPLTPPDPIPARGGSALARLFRR